MANTRGEPPSPVVDLTMLSNTVHRSKVKRQAWWSEERYKISRPRRLEHFFLIPQHHIYTLTASSTNSTPICSVDMKFIVFLAPLLAGLAAATALPETDMAASTTHGVSAELPMVGSA